MMRGREEIQWQPIVHWVKTQPGTEGAASLSDCDWESLRSHAAARRQSMRSKVKLIGLNRPAVDNRGVRRIFG